MSDSSDADVNSDDVDKADSKLASDSSSNPRSIIELYGRTSGSCGYCKNSTGPGTRKSFDLKAFSLSADHYQALIDSGWRRSGRYCYHPINTETCCPNYPISCDVSKFKLSRSKRLCIQNMNSFLAFGKTGDKLDFDHSNTNQCVLKELRCSEENKRSIPYEDMFGQLELKQVKKLRKRRFYNKCCKIAKSFNISKLDAFKSIIDDKLQKSNRIGTPSLESLLFPRKPAIDSNCAIKKPKHKLEISMLYADSLACKSIRAEEHELIMKYQKVIHKEGEEEWTMSRFSGFLVRSPLCVERMNNRDYVKCDSNDDDDKLSSDIYKGTDDFMIVKPPELPNSFGTYHCTYRLDGKLIAVGVIDVLPKCLTTVYFFYEPDYGFLNLGIYSALIEISMVRQMKEHFVSDSKETSQDLMQYYYMGFYVHECPKMRYKVTFKPSHLLCSETNKYIEAEICLDKLKTTKYARFHTGDEESARYEPSIEDLLSIPVHTPVTNTAPLRNYLMWIRVNLDLMSLNILLEDFFFPYAQLVGKTLAQKMMVQIKALHEGLVSEFERRQRSNATRLAVF